MKTLAVAGLLMTMLTTGARADDLVLYGAGSLREAMARIAGSFGQANGLTVSTQFGPSGRMRERIEKGEHVDVFTSADVGHARKLVDDGRASVMAVFARNTVCVLSPATFGATTATVLDKLVAQGVRIGVSPPKVDPLGDYTVRLFEMAESSRPGSAAALQTRRSYWIHRQVLHRQSPAIPTWMRFRTAASMPVSSIAPAVIGMRACYRTPRLSRFPRSFRLGPNMHWQYLRTRNLAH
jgi:ABC-type molybdate transport system substrate-binding protein